MIRTCKEPTCSRRFDEGKRQMDFCSTPCRKAWQNRALKRGYKLYAVAMKWRGQKRSHAKGAKNPPNRYFGDLTAFLDEWRREDRGLKRAALAQPAAATPP